MNELTRARMDGWLDAEGEAGARERRCGGVGRVPFQTCIPNQPKPTNHIDECIGIPTCIGAPPDLNFHATTRGSGDALPPAPRAARSVLHVQQLISPTKRYKPKFVIADIMRRVEVLAGERPEQAVKPQPTLADVRRQSSDANVTAAYAALANQEQLLSDEEVMLTALSARAEQAEEEEGEFFS